jgi:hypothetical protein
MWFVSLDLNDKCNNCLIEFQCARVLDANAYEKLHRVLVSYLGKCTFFLVGELACFDGDLVRSFCYATITDYAKSSLKDQIYKVTCV